MYLPEHFKEISEAEIASVIAAAPLACIVALAERVRTRRAKMIEPFSPAWDFVSATPGAIPRTETQAIACIAPTASCRASRRISHDPREQPMMPSSSRG